MKHCKHGIMSIVENWGNAIKKKEKSKKIKLYFLRIATVDSFNRIISYKKMDS